MKKINFELDDDNRPLTTLENLKLLLDTHGIKYSFDIIRSKTILELKDGTDKPNPCISSAYYKIINLVAKYEFEISMEALDMFIEELCKQNTFNAIKDAIVATKWDGKDRLQDFYDLVELDEDLKEFTELKEWYLKTFLWQIVHLNCFNKDGDDTVGRFILVLHAGDWFGTNDFINTLLPIEFRSYVGHDTFYKGNAALVQCNDLVGNFGKYKAKIHGRNGIYGKYASYYYIPDNSYFLDNKRTYKYLMPITAKNLKNNDIDMMQLYAQIYHELSNSDSMDDLFDVPEHLKEAHKLAIDYFRDETLAKDLLIRYIDINKPNDPTVEPLRLYDIFKKLVVYSGLTSISLSKVYKDLRAELNLLGFEPDYEGRYKVKFL